MNDDSKPVDFQRCILRACKLSGMSMQKTSIAAGKNKHWLRGVATRNSPTLTTMQECANIFEMKLQDLINICEKK